MHSAHSLTLHSRAATWRLQCCVKRAACSSLFDPASASKPVFLSGQLIIGERGMWKQHPASRETQHAHTFISRRVQRGVHSLTDSCMIGERPLPQRFTTVHLSKEDIRHTTEMFLWLLSEAAELCSFLVVSVQNPSCGLFILQRFAEAILEG